MFFGVLSSAGWVWKLGNEYWSLQEVFQVIWIQVIQVIWM